MNSWPPLVAELVKVPRLARLLERSLTTSSTLIACALSFSAVSVSEAAPILKGKIVDAATGEVIPARLYVQGEAGAWHHVKSAASEGEAIAYDRRRQPASEEVHTTLSAHPFQAELEPGTYTLTAERGKEYVPATRKITLTHDTEVTLELRRWTNMAAQGWFSGDTHMHRRVAELPQILLAEDLNVGLPLTAWVTDSRQSPDKANKNPERVPPPKLIQVDPTHVIWPVNTEYEIFTVEGKQHTLGAVFILNHREPFKLTVPPVKPIAAEAKRQGALLDLDKHNWPWSMTLMPTMNVHLFELTNNHVWRTQFLYGDWYPEYGRDLNVEYDAKGNFTERGWIDFGFKNYYALLNCGFDMKPSAGTASGVHPVPPGFGRVYVKIDGPFSYEKWIEGLAAGRSFVTTGPMLVSEQTRDGDEVTIRGTLSSHMPVGGVDVIVNGEVYQMIAAQPIVDGDTVRVLFETKVPLKTTSWIALRAFENRPDQRPRFAHTAPVHHHIPGKPLKPKPREVRYMIKRIEDERNRHQGVLSEEALAEHDEALAYFRKLLE